MNKITTICIVIIAVCCLGFVAKIFYDRNEHKKANLRAVNFMNDKQMLSRKATWIAIAGDIMRDSLEKNNITLSNDQMYEEMKRMSKNLIAKDSIEIANGKSMYDDIPYQMK